MGLLKPMHVIVRSLGISNSWPNNSKQLAYLQFICLFLAINKVHVKSFLFLSFVFKGEGGILKADNFV